MKIEINNHVTEEENPEEYGKKYYVNLSSLADEVKQKLAEEMKVSVKTVYELIEEYIASGHFIKLAPTKMKGRKSDNRVTNIRPSVDVVVAYIDVNFEHIKNCVQFLRNHTKITFDFNR